MNVKDFAYGTEHMINPMDVGSTHHMQKRLSLLPVWLQRKIVLSATKKAMKMGFVVEPYATFLFYEIPDPSVISHLLPDNFAPAKSRVFTGDTEKFYGIASLFRLHTSAFWGARAEFYMIARNSQTGLLSWIILDYASDTISYDHKSGLRSPNAPRAVVTTTCEGEFLGDFLVRDGKDELHSSQLEKKAIISSRKNQLQHQSPHHPGLQSQPSFCLCAELSLLQRKMRPLDEKLWIEGNTSIAYSRDLGGAEGSLFSLTFLPDEMKEAWEIPLSSLNYSENTWFPEIFGGKIDKIACFPYAQHMLSDSPGNSTHYGNRRALKEAAESIDFQSLKTFSEK